MKTSSEMFMTMLLSLFFGGDVLSLLLRSLKKKDELLPNSLFPPKEKQIEPELMCFQSGDHQKGLPEAGAQMAPRQAPGEPRFGSQCQCGSRTMVNSVCFSVVTRCCMVANGRPYGKCTANQPKDFADNH